MCHNLLATLYIARHFGTDNSVALRAYIHIKRSITGKEKEKEKLKKIVSFSQTSSFNAVFYLLLDPSFTFFFSIGMVTLLLSLRVCYRVSMNNKHMYLCHVHYGRPSFTDRSFQPVLTTSASLDHIAPLYITSKSLTHHFPNASFNNEPTQLHH